MEGLVFVFIIHRRKGTFFKWVNAYFFLCSNLHQLLGIRQKWWETMGLSHGFLLSWVKHINYNFTPSDILHPKAQQVKYELCIKVSPVSLSPWSCLPSFIFSTVWCSLCSGHNWAFSACGRLSPLLAGKLWSVLNIKTYINETKTTIKDSNTEVLH